MKLNTEAAFHRNTKTVYGVYLMAISFQQEVSVAERIGQKNRGEEVVGWQVHCGGFHILPLLHLRKEIPRRGSTQTVDCLRQSEFTVAPQQIRNKEEKRNMVWENGRKSRKLKHVKGNETKLCVHYSAKLSELSSTCWLKRWTASRMLIYFHALQTWIITSKHPNPNFTLTLNQVVTL